jgi:hypothetical protein
MIRPSVEIKKDFSGSRESTSMPVGEWIYTFPMEDRSPLDHGVGMHFVEAHPLAAKDTDPL